jgi:Mitochondrial domain of unknown function (DUF1713)
VLGGERQRLILSPARRPLKAGISLSRNSIQTCRPSLPRSICGLQVDLSQLPHRTHRRKTKPSADIHVSSFFSCHRPISVTAVVPTPATEAAFSSLFEPRTQNNKNKHNEVIFTLGNVVENLDSESGATDENSLQWQMLQDPSSEGVRHLDGAPRDIPLDKVISQFRPFRPPPPPQPFDEFAKGPAKPAKKAKARAKAVRPKKKSWSTTIIVTEYTGPSGEKTYQATTSDIVRVPSPGEKGTMVDPEAADRAPVQQPFLQRMMIRRQKWDRYRQQRRGRVVNVGIKKPAMLLISVRRQRKLKMKKHKYKKLMKRTRNLRRRLGKL